ncbi:septal ring lytic transglycosylase RlpA family protein [Pontibacter harenae]|uniref:septal ring lytic transglycosylase RlpA family protein n=1 Tax=Pontibacter harenae TaxID=2894083 RepID=UPI001E2E1728|nr:LysM peptidoglycan-binding domain-containing protein [Pontibacter harenae]MCC9168393.1 LysM peptidoglycan-binding domain-containing protein [Pontibacter harenae]
MVRVLFFTFFVAPLLSFSASAFGVSAVRDSIGVERKNGKIFVQHRVEPKETLYALSRKYGVPVSKIVEANPIVQNTINIGQIVLIPRKSYVPKAVASTAKATPVAALPDKTVPTASSRTFTVDDKGNKLHTVEPRQTLFSISKMHGVTVENLKKWNYLTENNISIGSQLVVGKGAATPTKQPVYVPEPDDVMKPKTAEEKAENAVATTTVSVQPAPERVENEESTTEETVKKIVESGMAEVLDPKADSNKYLAQHKTAPVGTIMQVKNPANGQVVYVRVIGKLSEADANNKTLVRLSKKAYQKLGVTGGKAPVEVSYMP